MTMTSGDLFLIRGLLLVIAQLLFLPIFGWLADVHFGRYKVMNTGIWIMWVCSVAGVVAMIVQASFPETSRGKLYHRSTLFHSIQWMCSVHGYSSTVWH